MEIVSYKKPVRLAGIGIVPFAGNLCLPDTRESQVGRQLRDSFAIRGYNHRNHLHSGGYRREPYCQHSSHWFGLIMDRTNQFSTSSLVNGKIYGANYAAPTPSKLTTAVGDMQTAYTDAAGRKSPTATELGAGNIDGKTIAPGLYKWSTGVMIPTAVSLYGGPTDVWIFQIAGNLNVGSGAIVTLRGGAQPKNIFWQVAGQTTLGSTSDFKGVILSKTAIVMNSKAKLNGRALAQTAVTMIADSVTAAK